MLLSLLWLGWIFPAQEIGTGFPIWHDPTTLWNQSAFVSILCAPHPLYAWDLVHQNLAYLYMHIFFFFSFFAPASIVQITNSHSIMLWTRFPEIFPRYNRQCEFAHARCGLSAGMHSRWGRCTFYQKLVVNGKLVSATFWVIIKKLITPCICSPFISILLIYKLRVPRQSSLSLWFETFGINRASVAFFFQIHQFHLLILYCTPHTKGGC